MALYNFIANMWVMRRYTAEQVQAAVTKGYITQQEADEILAMPQVKEVPPTEGE